MELISVVIPMYGKWPMVHDRLWEIFEHCLQWMGKLEVIVCEDASGEDFHRKRRWWLKSGTYPENALHFYDQKTNLGFSGNVNFGLDQAKGDIVIVHSSDVIVSGNYITPLYMHLLENPKDLVGHRLLTHDTGWNKFGDRIFPYVEGYLLAGTREFWSDVRFDTCYGKYDYEDIDLSTQAVKKGYNLVGIDLPVMHIGGATIYQVDGVSKRMEHTRHNKNVFREKWINQNENSS